MFVTLLILQLIAHVLADFTFQPQRWCNRKDETLYSTEHLLHFVIVFVLSWLCSMQTSFWCAALVIAVLHFFFDMLKGILSRREKLPYAIFFIDQSFHLLTVVAVVYWFSETQTITFPFEIGSQQVWIVFSFLFCVKPANIVIREVLKTFEIPVSEPADKNELMNAGKLIGVLERIISLALILIDQFAAVGFIIAAKSLLRFRDTATARTEYLLIGTLLSFGIAILLGIFCRYTV
ncbi:MAG: DUF3307 domain-containing protein [Bacteroidales bacterium]|jgi:hypothetical protein|nr:DUF3307 domain-containing protein [Bacteroidales bacterium]